MNTQQLARKHEIPGIACLANLLQGRSALVPVVGPQSTVALSQVAPIAAVNRDRKIRKLEMQKEIREQREAEQRMATRRRQRNQVFSSD